MRRQQVAGQQMRITASRSSYKTVTADLFVVEDVLHFVGVALNVVLDSAVSFHLERLHQFGGNSALSQNHFPVET